MQERIPGVSDVKFVTGSRSRRWPPHRSWMATHAEDDADDSATDTGTTTAEVANTDLNGTSPPTEQPAALQSPPFWKTHGRSVSAASYQSTHLGRPPPIQLEDHSEETDDQARACWARHVTIDDYTVVSGPTGIGAYVVWNCTVQTLKGAPFTIRKRFSEFDKLRADLIRAFPHAEGSIPPLPRKSVICTLLGSIVIQDLSVLIRRLRQPDFEPSF
ncbi:hypothetical protein ANO11243_039940 [Dothideomycetidae sp. 11243]|nr:hypothetical protein ANO11243_039940 [fungal sp. No.11243]